TSLADEVALLAELRALAEEGRHREVLERLERLPPEVTASRTPFALLAAEAHGRLGAHREAGRWAATALAVARGRGERHAELRAGLARGMAETQHNIGISRRALGDYRGALAAAEEAVRLAEQLGNEALSALALAGRADLHLVQGDLELAAAELARAGASYERLQHPVGLAEVWRLEAGVARARGDGSGAAARLRRAAELARGQGSAHTLAEIERDLGGALEAIG